MSETKELLRRGVGEFEPMPDALERVLVRRDRKRLLGSERGPVIGPATSPSPAGSPSPVTQPPSTFTERFDSPVNGLSIGYPSGWRTRAATEPWGHDAVAFSAPDVDVIYHPTLKDDLYLAMVSEPLGAKSGLEWVQNLTPPPVGICTRAVGSGGGSTTLGLDGAVAGWIEYCDTPFGSDSVGIVATATRGYIINLHVGDEHAERRLQATYGGVSIEGKGDTIRRRIAAVLKTVELRPEDALDALNPSESP
jgi:hypothetical protein